MKYALVLLLVVACDRPTETQYGSCTEIAAEAQRQCDRTIGSTCDTRFKDVFEACQREIAVGREVCIDLLCVKGTAPSDKSEVP
jgi:hypothetical protein